MEIRIKRNYHEKQTEGLLELRDGMKVIFTCKVLELPWKNNKKNVSCIPEGRYNITKEMQVSRGEVLRLHDVPGRAGILFHTGNYNIHTKGCILPGMEFIDINNDGLKDVVRSREAIQKLWELLPDLHNYVYICS